MPFHRTPTCAQALNNNLNELRRRQDEESLRVYLIRENCFSLLLSSHEMKTAPITMEELKKLARVWKLNERRNFWKTHADKNSMVAALCKHLGERRMINREAPASFESGLSITATNSTILQGGGSLAGGSMSMAGSLEEGSFMSTNTSSLYAPMAPAHGKHSMIRASPKITNYCGMKYFFREIKSRELTTKSRHFETIEPELNVVRMVDEWRRDDINSLHKMDSTLGSTLTLGKTSTIGLAKAAAEAAAAAASNPPSPTALPRPNGESDGTTNENVANVANDARANRVHNNSSLRSLQGGVGGGVDHMHVDDAQLAMAQAAEQAEATLNKHRSLAGHLAYFSLHVDPVKKPITVENVQTFVNLSETDDVEVATLCLIGVSNISSIPSVRSTLLDINGLHVISALIPLAKGSASHMAAALFYYYFSTDTIIEDRIQSSCFPTLVANVEATNPKIFLLAMYTLNNLLPSPGRYRLCELIIKMIHFYQQQKSTNKDVASKEVDKALYDTFLQVLLNCTVFVNTHMTLFRQDILDILGTIALYACENKYADTAAVVAQILNSFLFFTEASIPYIGHDFAAIVTDLLVFQQLEVLKYVMRILSITTMSGKSEIIENFIDNEIISKVATLVLSLTPLSVEICRDIAKYFFSITRVHNFANDAYIDQLVKLKVPEAILELVQVKSRYDSIVQRYAINGLQGILSASIEPSRYLKLAEMCYSPLLTILKDSHEIGAIWCLYNISSVLHKLSIPQNRQSTPPPSSIRTSTADAPGEDENDGGYGSDFEPMENQSSSHATIKNSKPSINAKIENPELASSMYHRGIHKKILEFFCCPKASSQARSAYLQALVQMSVYPPQIIDELLRDNLLEKLAERITISTSSIEPVVTNRLINQRLKGPSLPPKAPPQPDKAASGTTAQQQQQQSQKLGGPGVSMKTSAVVGNAVSKPSSVHAESDSNDELEEDEENDEEAEAAEFARVKAVAAAIASQRENEVNISKTWEAISKMLLAVSTSYCGNSMRQSAASGSQVSNGLSNSQIEAIIKMLKVICSDKSSEKLIAQNAVVCAFLSLTSVSYELLGPIILAVMNLCSKSNFLAMEGISVAIFNSSCSDDNAQLMVQDNMILNTCIKLLRSSHTVIPVVEAMKTLSGISKCVELMIQTSNNAGAIISDLIVIALLRTSSMDVKVVCAEVFYNMICHQEYRKKLLTGEFWWGMSRLCKEDHDSIRAVYTRILWDLSCDDDDVLSIMRNNHVLAFLHELSMTSPVKYLEATLATAFNFVLGFNLINTSSHGDKKYALTPHEYSCVTKLCLDCLYRSRRAVSIDESLCLLMATLQNSNSNSGYDKSHNNGIDSECVGIDLADILMYNSTIWLPLPSSRTAVCIILWELSKSNVFTRGVSLIDLLPIMDQTYNVLPNLELAECILGVFVHYCSHEKIDPSILISSPCFRSILCDCLGVTRDLLGLNKVIGDDAVPLTSMETSGGGVQRSTGGSLIYTPADQQMPLESSNEPDDTDIAISSSAPSNLSIIGTKARRRSVLANTSKMTLVTQGVTSNLSSTLSYVSSEKAIAMGLSMFAYCLPAYLQDSNVNNIFGSFVGGLFNKTTMSSNLCRENILYILYNISLVKPLAIHVLNNTRILDLLKTYVESQKSKGREDCIIACNYASTILRNFSLLSFPSPPTTASSPASVISLMATTKQSGANALITTLISDPAVGDLTCFNIVIFFYTAVTLGAIQPPAALNSNSSISQDEYLTPQFILNTVEKMSKQAMTDDVECIYAYKYVVGVVLERYSKGMDVSPTFVQSVFAEMQSEEIQAMPMKLAAVKSAPFPISTSTGAATSTNTVLPGPQIPLQILRTMETKPLKAQRKRTCSYTPIAVKDKKKMDDGLVSKISGDACMTAVNNGDVKTDPYPLQMYAKIIKRFDRVDYRENESDS